MQHDAALSPTVPQSLNPSI